MTWNLNEVIEVRPVGDHLVFVRFDDGMAGELDLSAYAARGGIFEPLADIGIFNQVAIEGGTLAWPNGADIAPERLYAMLEAAPKPESSRNL